MIRADHRGDSSAERLNVSSGPPAFPGVIVTRPTNKRIAVLPNQPRDMLVSCCKFWTLDCGTGHKLQHSDLATERNGQGARVSP